MTWSTIGLGAIGVGEFALLAVLARYLDEVQFGVMTATLIVIRLGKVLLLGLGPALVQRERLEPDHVRSAFAMSLLLVVALVAGVWTAAPALAAAFRMETDVTRAMSLLFVCQLPGLVPEALLQRRMDMRALARGEVCGVLVSVPLGIGSAMLGHGVWALVVAHIAQAAVKSAVLLWSCPHEWALWPRRGATRPLVRFSSGHVTAGLCSFGATEGDNFVVLTWLSLGQLGIYSRAYRLMAMPAMFLGQVVDRVVFPLLARVQNDRERLQTAYGRGVSLVATIMAPTSAVCIVLAPEVVHVVLGADWSEVVLPFQVLMAGLVFRTGYKISDMLARATGTVYRRAWRQAVFAAMILAGALVGTRWGVVGVAAGVLFALAGNYLMMAWLSLQTTGMAWSRFLSLHVRGLLLAAAAAGIAGSAAALVRSAGGAPLVVLSASLAGLLLALLGALRWTPRQVFGVDGLWLFQTLTGRAGA